MSELWIPPTAIDRGRRAVSRDTRYQQMSIKGTPLDSPTGRLGRATKWHDTKTDCTVIVTHEPEGTGRRWHMSIAHKEWYPSWDEIADARYALIPDEAYMVMLLPPRSDYVNIHPNCFHLHEVPEARKDAQR